MKKYHTELKHNGIRFRFNNRFGYAILGEGKQLDRRAPMSLLELKQFNVGAKKGTIKSRHDGLHWITPSGKHAVWRGDNAVALL